MKKVRVWLRSKPGMYAQYDGYVDTWVDEDADRDDIFYAACSELKRKSFPDRNAGMWTMEKYEQV